MRILYLQHVDWQWIPQRPHFLARELVRSGHDLDVFFVRGWRRSGTVAPDQGLALPRLPWPMRGCPRWATPGVRTVDAALLRRQLASVVSRGYDLVWVTHPRLFAAIKDLPRLPPLVYDCMDDAPELEPRGRAYVTALDRQLIGRAGLVLVSSPALHAKLAEIVPDVDRLHLVRNGCRDDYAWPARNLPAGGEERPARPRAAGTTGPLHADAATRVLFYGTIGGWLDLDVLDALAGDPRIDLRLIGPVRAELPAPLLARCRPPLPHLTLLDFAAEWAQWLLLPFRRDAFSESVDPVKLHEYVGLARPILAPDLEVLRPARAFIRTYTSAADAVTAVTNGAAGDEASAQERLQYLDRSTWRARADQIEHLLGAAVTA